MAVYIIAGMVLFYLNREDSFRQVRAEAGMTVLRYLRENRLVGTKEGCASGDCGACTVVVAYLEEGRPVFRGLNACIAPLAAVDRKWLITVEGLKREGRLHSVQRAMVSAHASQCGFCTPGFVMSLFAFCKSAPRDRQAATAAIAGNLCRCTGYRPIVDAARRLSRSVDDGYGAAAVRRRVRRMEDGAAVDTVRRLAGRIAENPDVPLVAGGTDLMLRVTQQLEVLPEAIALGGVAPLSVIGETANAWDIGATANWEAVGRVLGPHLPSLSAMIDRFGSPQIRHLATVGGNVANASPVADGPPVWMALGATLRLRQGGRRRRLPIDEFFLGYKRTDLRAGEWIERILVPRPRQDSVFRVYKVSKRWEDDISSVLLAFWVRRGARGRIRAVRVAGGGLAAVPKRATTVERFLVGRQWSEESFVAAARLLGKDFTPIDDMRASAAYRLRVAAALMRRFARETVS